MKKTYIIPESLTIQLGTCRMMAESVPVDPNDPITDPNEILTKEDNSSDQGVWDEEW